MKIATAEDLKRLLNPKKAKYGNKPVYKCIPCGSSWMNREAFGVLCPKCRKKPTRFDSMAEFERYQELALLQRCGKIDDLKIHPKYRLGFGAYYCGDFEYKVTDIEALNGFEIVTEDVKSRPTMTPVFRLKKKLFESTYGRKIKIWRKK